MHRFTLAVGLAFAIAGHVPAQQPKDKKIEVRVLDLKGVKLPSADGGRVDKPVLITDAVKLAEVFPDATSQAILLKQFDLNKHKLLFFQWAGSGGDRLTAQVKESKDGPIVEFRYVGGMTDDLRRHAHLFALPGDAKWRLEK